MRRLFLAAVLIVVGVTAVTTSAQFRSYRSYAFGELPERRDGFTFCRLAYTQVRSEPLGQGWATDYAAADQNLMVRLSELTKTEVTWSRPNFPAHAVVRATDPALFQCPFLFASDVGTVGFDEHEAAALREYLLKGGFLWVDDFWGPAALRNWLAEIGRVLPEAEVQELEPGHPIYSTFYSVDEVPQIPSIQFWRQSGGRTSERDAASAHAGFYGLSDPNGRLVVFMSHNTDIADGWERENEDYQFFHLFSPRGYAVGVNVAIWSMTH